jgi:hypothetical protein
MELNELAVKIDSIEHRLQNVSDTISKHIITRRLCITDKNRVIRSQWGYEPRLIDITLNSKKQMVKMIIGPSGVSLYGNNCQHIHFKANYDRVFGEKTQVTLIDMKAGRGVYNCFRIFSERDNSIEMFIDNKFGSMHPLCMSFDENNEVSLAVKYRNKSLVVISSKEEF